MHGPSGHFRKGNPLCCPWRTAQLWAPHTQVQVSNARHRHDEFPTTCFFSFVTDTQTSLRGLHACIPPLICVTVGTRLASGERRSDLRSFVPGHVRLRFVADLGVGPGTCCLFRRAERGTRLLPVLELEHQVQVGVPA